MTPSERSLTGPPEERLDFFVVGDSGQDTPIRRRTMEALQRWHDSVLPKFLVLAGDNFYPHGVVSTEDAAWRVHVDEVFGRLPLPIYPCLGNHDNQGNPDAQVAFSKTNDLWRMPARYHSFVYDFGKGNSAEFFVLDSQPLRLDIPLFSVHPQASWLAQRLARSTATWKLVIVHHPLISGGPKESGSRLARNLLPAFEGRGVDFLLSGHNHTLELIDPGTGWMQVVSGAFAAPDPVCPIPGTLFSRSEGGFAWISLEASRAWVSFINGSGERIGGHEITRSAIA